MPNKRKLLGVDDSASSNDASNELDDASNTPIDLDDATTNTQNPSRSFLGGAATVQGGGGREAAMEDESSMNAGSKSKSSDSGQDNGGGDGGGGSSPPKKRKRGRPKKAAAPAAIVQAAPVASAAEEEMFMEDQAEDGGIEMNPEIMKKLDQHKFVAPEQARIASGGIGDTVWQEPTPGARIREWMFLFHVVDVDIPGSGVWIDPATGHPFFTKEVIVGEQRYLRVDKKALLDAVFEYMSVMFGCISGDNPKKPSIEMFTGGLWAETGPKELLKRGKKGILVDAFGGHSSS